MLRMRRVRAAVRRGRLLYEKRAEIMGRTEAGVAPAVEAACHADVVPLALGESAGEMTAEAAPRAFITLPGLQADAAGSPVPIRP